MIAQVEGLLYSSPNSPGFPDLSTALLEDLKHALAEVALCCPLLVLYQGSNSNTVELGVNEQLDGKILLNGELSSTDQNLLHKSTVKALTK